ncbi:MAG: hydroxymethylbilane synthase [Ilumatobacteraceae bacterium]
MTVLRIATRSSAQARTQAAALAEAVVAAHPGVEIEWVWVDTTGDRDATTPLHQMGGQGVFVKEVQRAVMEGRADVAAHSAKDLPSSTPDELVIGAFTRRRTANDALVGSRLDDLAPGATIATGSVRRRAQLARLRPDLEFIDLRGNIPTRLERVPDGGAIVMAVAALEILGLTERIAEMLAIGSAVPMVGQGCVAAECRADDVVTAGLLAAVDDGATRRAVECERAFLAELGAGCSMPVAAHHDADGVLRAFMARDDGSHPVQLERHVAANDDHVAVGAEIAAQCRAQVSAGGR